jgi:hypothetical protein
MNLLSEQSIGPCEKSMSNPAASFRTLQRITSHDTASGE